jgi:hypothetical protein
MIKIGLFGFVFFLVISMIFTQGFIAQSFYVVATSGGTKTSTNNDNGNNKSVTQSITNSSSTNNGNGNNKSVTLTESITISSAITNSSSTNNGNGNNKSVTQSITNSSSTNNGNGNNKSVASNDVQKNILNTGSITIETIYSSLVPGFSYTITPNPKTGTGNLNVTDGDSEDSDGMNNGIILISQVPQGRYVVTLANAPTTFFPLVRSTITNLHGVHMNQIIVFQVIPITVNLSQLSPVQITVPELKDDTLAKWNSSSAKLVNNINSIKVTNVNQGPQITVAGINNSTAINNAINTEPSVFLNTFFAPLTKGSTVINTIGLENYSLPNSTQLATIIPTIVANVSTGYVAATPPMSGVIAGQQMIITVANSLIPSFGGLKELDIHSSPNIKSDVTNATVWFVAEADKTIPPSIGSSGIVGVPTIFVNIQHPFEDNLGGLNWSDPSNFAMSPTLKIIANKTSTIFKQDIQGCPILHSYTLVSGSWTTSGVNETEYHSISSTQCLLVLQSKHLSKFAFSMEHMTSITSSASGLSGTNTVAIGNSPSSDHVAAAISQDRISISTQKVNQANTVIELTSNENPSTSGQPITFTAKVSTTMPSTVMPTGIVIFSIDGKDTPTTLSSGKATFSSKLSIGYHDISAQYFGDNKFSKSTSNILSQKVSQDNKPTVPTSSTQKVSQDNKPTVPTSSTQKVSQDNKPTVSKKKNR